MYENYPNKPDRIGAALMANPVDHNPTVEENINERIRYYESEIARLNKSKEDLAPLLKMRIRDLRMAVEY